MHNVLLVGSDLDGSLLAHDDYRYDEARPALELLDQLRIPLVLVSSKTRAEMLELRREMGNEHPFVVENGSAVFIPERYFDFAPEDCEQVDGFWCRSFSRPRNDWAPLLAEMREALPGEFQDFASASVETIQSLTGLEPHQAKLANQREYSEPIHWCGSEDGLRRFIEAFEREGARVYRGGRFYTIAGATDKGKAYAWLRELYSRASGNLPVHDLCIGDGANDVPLLDVGKTALLIPAPGRPLPQVNRDEGILVGVGEGPVAWADGVSRWLKALYQAN